MNREELRKKERFRGKEYYRLNRARILIKCKEYRDAHKEEAHAYQREYGRKNRVALNEKTRIWRTLLQMEVFEHYGSKCACCGEESLEFLELDHINGNGNAHRRSLGMTTSNQLHAWLRHNNYPEGFRLLCSNCNHAIGVYGYCPHVEKRDFYAYRIEKGFKHTRKGKI